MNASINSMLAFVAIGLAGACTSQAAVQAKFHLPVAAHLGKALLPPGDYKIRVFDLSSGRNEIFVEGVGNTFYQMPVATDQLGSEGPSSLQLVKRGTDYFVREYKSAFAGKTYTFGVPKEWASHRTQIIQMAN